MVYLSEIIQPKDLDRFSDTRESQSIIPKIIYQLVIQSCATLSVCRIPYGDAINQPGLDGVVETAQGFKEFVPGGKSLWEIGTNSKPAQKATEDFDKRTKEFTLEERADLSFIFVTPRSSASGGWSETKQREWLEMRKDKGWKSIRILDGTKLADWISLFPAVGKELARHLDLITTYDDIQTPAEHWDYIHSCNKSIFIPKLFLIGREECISALHSLFNHNVSFLTFIADEFNDVLDFVSAFIEDQDFQRQKLYSLHCLIIKDKRTFLSILQRTAPHVLIIHPKVDLQNREYAIFLQEAIKKGHSIILFSHSKRIVFEKGKYLDLKQPTSLQIREVLENSGINFNTIQELVRVGKGGLGAIQRYVSEYGIKPSYIESKNIQRLAQACLIGSWDGSKIDDKTVIEKLLECSYDEWIKPLRTERVNLRLPFVCYGERWEMIPREEAWAFLGDYICDNDLERFQALSMTVLAEEDPQFELPKEQRNAAQVYGKVFSYSSLIRKGITETLCLIGGMGNALTKCSHEKINSIPYSVVYNLLKELDWKRWAALESLMPLLAEASPEALLDAYESALNDLSDTLFHKVIREGNPECLLSKNYMNGIIRALEVLAWSSNYLPRVSLILADLAYIEKSILKRSIAFESLRKIFLPWYVQTQANFEERVDSALKGIIQEQPQIGWELLLEFIGYGPSHTMYIQRPTFRKFISKGWSKKTTQQDYWKQIKIFSDLAVDLAMYDINKLCQLIEELPGLFPESRHRLLEFLDKESIEIFSEEERVEICEYLKNLAVKHRRYITMPWALNIEEIIDIENVLKKFMPNTTQLKYRYLFDNENLVSTELSWDEKQIKIYEMRKVALQDVFNENGVKGIMSFILSFRKFKHYAEIGYLLEEILTLSEEDELFAYILENRTEQLFQLFWGFVRKRYYNKKLDWLIEFSQKELFLSNRIEFLIRLPFTEEIWEYLSILPEEEQNLYWNTVIAKPTEIQNNFSIPINNFLKVRRSSQALLCVWYAKTQHIHLEESDVAKCFLDLDLENVVTCELTSYEYHELIKDMQASTLDPVILSQIEWKFLPYLDRFFSTSTGCRPVTLEKRLSSEPHFFIEIVDLCADTNKDEFQRQNALKLLLGWKYCAGIVENNWFASQNFNKWISEITHLIETREDTKFILYCIGKALAYAPKDPDGFWIHKDVATVLNQRDKKEMRSAFAIELYNQRGWYLDAQEEGEDNLSDKYKDKAKILEKNGYTRLATEIRKLANLYKEQSDSKANKVWQEY